MSVIPCAPQAGSALITARELASLLNLSLPTVERMKARGQLPGHLVLSGNAHRWRLAEILAWIESGCPDQQNWERSKAAKGARR